MTPALESREVSRRFGRRWALRRVSLVFAPGTVTAIVGDNGAGKSTLLQILAGFVRPSEGEVLAFDTPLGAFPPRDVRRRMAVLAHAPGIYPDLSGRENLVFFSRFHERPGAGRCSEVGQTLARLGLEDAADRPVRTYSRGMIQRLALGRVLLQEAELWLLDEPTTGLDASGTQLLAGLIASARAAGRTVVAVTHDLPALGPAVDRVVRLTQGRLVSDGPNGAPA
ncbi:MAG: heme ABC exporter ATP-binding protein CcmA [Myxococcota bacterium]